MSRRREPIPFASIVEADRFRSNVAPPPRGRASAGQMAGRVLLGLTVVAGLVGSVLIGLPALSSHQPASHVHQSEAQTGAGQGR
ncbi:hypothetical protein [Streptomyces sp. TS71-3]|uniref:hypothetical protein n=1 Tax=Streptomyces sp. TS71-3 TaxID=2733862 RepID=UPI001B2E8DBC|nr:hypothetical protein [Streptomyces sp. TS71-3]GHJ36404.1 hypothetical protein Sm713_20130 [Streptomyces sp. TS71-3]